MPKTKLPKIDRTPETLVALKQFKEGDRVFNTKTKQHGVFTAPQKNNSCWVQYDTLYGEEWFLNAAPHDTDPLELELCSCHHPVPRLLNLQLDTASQEEVVIRKAAKEPDINLSGQLNLISTPPASTEDDSPIPNLLKPTSESLQTSLFPHSLRPTCLSSEVLVQIFPALAIEKELLAITQACFLKESDFCNFKSLKHSVLKMFPVSSDKTSILSSVPSRNWGMWGIGKSAMGGETSLKGESESFLWVLTGDVRSSLVKENRPSLIDCLDAPGVGIVDRARGGDRTYLDIAPTIRTASVDKNGHQGGSGAFKVIESSGITRPVRPEELERLMGWEENSTAFGTTIEGEIVPISNTQRHKMLGNGIIPAEIEDICNSLRPFLEETKNNESAIADNSLVEVNNESAIADSQIMGESEARFTIGEINNACNKIRNLLVDLDERQGYIALGFTSMSQLLKSNLFSKAKSTLHLELVAGKIEKENLLVEVGTFPESQLRSLNKLRSEYHGEAIALAKNIAGDRPLTAKDVSASVASMVLERPETRVRSIVDIVKEKTFVPYTKASNYQCGDIVRIKASGNSTLRPCDGYWGIIDRISDFAYHVSIAVEKEIALCKVDEMTRVEVSEQDKIVFEGVSKRIKKLALGRNDLDSSAWWILEGLSRQTFFTPKQLALLEFLERQYGGD